MRSVPLEYRHRRERKRWAVQHLNWGFGEWCNVMFSDETRIALRLDTRRQRVWRRKRRGRKYHHVQEVNAFAAGSMTFWGGVMFGRRKPLVPIAGRLNSQRYVAEVLRPFAPAVSRPSWCGISFCR